LPDLSEPKEEADVAEGPVRPSSVEDVVKDLKIVFVDPIENVSGHHTESNVFIIDKETSINDVAIIKLHLTGPMIDGVTSVGSGEDYLKYFIDNHQIEIKIDSFINIHEYISDATIEVDATTGAALYLIFNPTKLDYLKAPNDEPLHIMRIMTLRGSGHVDVVADDKSLLDDLIKLSSTSGTTPLYETVSPSGETIIFTPADLVIGGGKLTSKGKKFNPTKRKGKSLADRVMAPGYGKVRKS
jgi:hypothetical protein